MAEHLEQNTLHAAAGVTARNGSEELSLESQTHSRMTKGSEN